MYFSILKDDFKKQCDDKSCRVENKQRIRLSVYTYTTLVSDCKMFYPENAGGRRGELPSGFINHILDCYRKTAVASVAFRLSERRHELEELLHDLKYGKNYAINLLLKEEEQKLTAQCTARCQEKGCSVSFRMNVRNMEYLCSDVGQQEGKYYQDDIGLYVRAVLEEFAHLPYIEREIVYCKEIRDVVDKAIEKNRVLKLFLKSTYQTNDTVRNHCVYVKPYQLCQDPENLYNYVVGYMRNSHDAPWKHGAVRLSSVARCAIIEKESFLSAAARKELARQLEKHGVQYISSNEDTQKIVVQLTPAGEKMYHRLLHVRPAYTAKREERVYEFDCTQWQALNYFFKFGRDVKILEPEKLAHSFRKRYQAAAAQYANEENPL